MIDTGRIWRVLAQTRRIFVSAAVRLYYGHGIEWAGSLAYYSLLSVFPAALLGVSLAAFVVDEGWAIERIVHGVGGLLPTVSGTLARDVRDAVEHRGKIGAVAILVLTWAGSRVFSTLTNALDRALGRAHRKEHIVIALAREVLLLGATGIVLFAGTVVGPALPQLPALATAGLRTALFGGGIMLLYTFVPAPRPPARAAAAGALVATLLLVVAMPLFSQYVSKLGRYNLIYGPLAIVIVVLVWFWLASVVVLYGVYVTASIEAALADQGAPASDEAGTHDA